MRTRAFAAAAALLVALVLARGASAVMTEVRSVGISDGNDTVMQLDCGGSRVLGGGFDPEDLVDGLRHTRSAPLDLLTTLDGLKPHPTDWGIGIQNASGAPGFLTFKGAVICGSLPGLVSYAETELSIGAGEHFQVTALCPEPLVAVGGGFASGALTSLRLGWSTLVFDRDAEPQRLGDLAAGEHGAPVGVAAMVENLHPNLPLALRVVAVCADLDPPGEDPAPVVTVVADQTADPGEAVARSASCPSDTTATGGAIEPTASVPGVEVASNGPLFFGFPFPIRLAAMPDGAQGAPVGWRGALRNHGANARAFKVAAICVPEAEGGPAAAAVLALLASLGAPRFRGARAQLVPHE